MRLLLAGVLALAAPAQVQAQSGPPPVRIGVITSLSESGSYLGQDIRDGLQLAVDLEGGKLGGVPVSLQVADDAGKPALGKEIATRFLRNDGIRLFTGIVFSNVLQAVVPEVIDADAIYISANAGPSTLAGKNCDHNYFVASWQNDTQHEIAGLLATQRGYEKAFLVAPNYQAGRDGLNGFKRTYKGSVVGELYTSLDAKDFSAELAQIRAARPDVVYESEPGALSIGFLRQYQQAGLFATTPLIVTEGSFDAVTLAAIGEAADGLTVVGHYNDDFFNAANKVFVQAWAAKYGRPITPFASQGYDAARLIGAALRKNAGGADAGRIRSALRTADFESVRGAFKFGPNQHPVQDWYALRVDRVDGKHKLVTQGVVSRDRGDVYAAECKITDK